jgi:DNA polymerase-3 subunit epsilon
MPSAGRNDVDYIDISIGARPVPLAPRLTDAERAAHAGMVGTLGEKALWLKVAAG